MIGGDTELQDEEVDVSNGTTCVLPFSLRGQNIANLSAKALKRKCGKGIILIASHSICIFIYY